jgi:hypothetical protein
MGNTASTTPTATAAISDVPKFESLPKELRLQIWEDIAESIEPEFVVIKAVDILKTNSYARYYDGYVYRIYGSASIGSELLQVNQEAREVVLKKSRLMFADADSQRRPLYFNPDKDSLHLDNVGLGQWALDDKWENIIESSPALQAELALVKHLVQYSVSIFVDSINRTSHPVVRLMPYESLETLSIPVSSICPTESLYTPLVPYEAQMIAAVEDFWTTKMNPEQVRKGKSPTQPPKITFITFPEVRAFSLRMK